jgi:uncharacterized protein YcfJ
MKTFTSVALAAALMASSSAPVLAQGYNSAQSQYQRNQQDYDSSYRAYQTARDQYDRDKADYDRRYGAGAYDRYYSQGSWNGDRWDNRQNTSNNDNRYNPYDRYRDTPCERMANANSRDRTTGTVLGALIGGALGATAAGSHSEGEGAVLGAIAGGLVGNQIAGNSSDADRYAARCDNDGYYYDYDQTQPYREDTSTRGRRSGRYDSNYYTRQRCRLAPAPTQYGDRTDYRYVRVCPDRNNRYRITN